VISCKYSRYGMLNKVVFSLIDTLNNNEVVYLGFIDDIAQYLFISRRTAIQYLYKNVLIRKQYRIKKY